MQIRLLVLLLFKWILLLLKWYLGLQVELIIKQYFFYYIDFWDKCLHILSLHLVYRDIPDTKIVLVLDLQDIATSKTCFSFSAELISCLKSFHPQCSIMFSGLFHTVVYMQDFILVVAPLNYVVNTLLIHRITVTFHVSN